MVFRSASVRVKLVSYRIARPSALEPRFEVLQLAGFVNAMHAIAPGFDRHAATLTSQSHWSWSNHARLNAIILCLHTRAWQALGITRTARELRHACLPVRIDLETDLRCRPGLACRWAERGANAELQALTICCLRERAAPPAPAALAHGRSAAADRVHRGRLQPRATGLPSGATALLQRHDHGLRRRRVPIALALWRSQISSRSCLNLLGVGLP